MKSKKSEKCDKVLWAKRTERNIFHESMKAHIFCKCHEVKEFQPEVKKKKLFRKVVEYVCHCFDGF